MSRKTNLKKVLYEKLDPQPRGLSMTPLPPLICAWAPSFFDDRKNCNFYILPCFYNRIKNPSLCVYKFYMNKNTNLFL